MKTYIKIHSLWSAVLILAVFLPLSGSEAQEETYWTTVQNASQGYSFRAPRSAIVRLYQPEGILHLEIPSTHQVISVQVLENPTNLSAQDWTEAHLFNSQERGINPLVTRLPVTGRGQVRIGRQMAETFVVIGPVTTTRRTVLAGSQQVLMIDAASGEAKNEDLLLQILTSFEPFETAGQTSVVDRGFEVVRAAQSQTIPTIPVPFYSQTDPRWICDQIGTCGCWWGNCSYYTGIGDAGCYITSEAMVFDYYTGHYKDPQELNDCLTENNGYGLWQGCGWGLCAATYNPIAACKPRRVNYLGLSGDLDVLDQDLASGHPAIAWVDGGTHYVVVTGKKDGLYQINDPLYPRNQIYPGQIIYVVRLQGPLPSRATPTPRPPRTPAPYQFFFPEIH